MVSAPGTDSQQSRLLLAAALFRVVASCFHRLHSGGLTAAKRKQSRATHGMKKMYYRELSWWINPYLMKLWSLTKALDDSSNNVETSFGLEAIGHSMA